MGYILLTAGVHERTKWAWLTTYWSNSCPCFWFFMALSPFTLSLIPPIILMATITVLCSRYPIFFCNNSGTRAFNWTFSVLRAFSSVFILVMEFIYIAVGSAIGMTALWYSYSVWPKPPYLLQCMTLCIFLRLTMGILFRFTQCCACNALPILSHATWQNVLAGLEMFIGPCWASYNNFLQN